MNSSGNSTAHKLLLMTGAGASKPLGLPTTTEFDQEISSGLSVTGLVREYLGADRGKDVEAILGTLEVFQGGSEFTRFLVERLTKNNKNSDLNQIQRYLSDAAKELRRIKKAIHTRLGTFQPSAATKMYSGIISELDASFGAWSLSFATTNYDLTFEEAVSNGLTANGSTADFVRYPFEMDRGRLVYSAKTDFKWATSEVEYFKLHGSLDWHRDNQQRCTMSGAATTPDDPETVPILYPGNKSVPDVEPFASLHGRFYRRLSEADTVIVVGFAFRDGYLNTTFENVLSIRSELPVYVINPLEISEFPSDSKLPSILQRFKNVQHIRSKIGLEAEPLGLAKILQPPAPASGDSS